LNNYVNTLVIALMNSILLTGYCFILPVVTFIEPQRPVVRYYRTCCFPFFNMHLDVLIFLYFYCYWTDNHTLLLRLVVAMSDYRVNVPFVYFYWQHINQLQ